MFLSNHAAVGALLALQTNNPVSAFALGYVSHYLVDMIPHGDERVGPWIKKKNEARRAALVVSIDLTVMAAFFMSLSWRVDFSHPYVVAAGVLGAILPDFISGFYDFLRKYLSTEKRKHYKERGGWLINFAKRSLWDNFFLERQFFIHRKIHSALKYDISLRNGIVLQTAILGFLYWSILHFLKA